MPTADRAFGRAERRAQRVISELAREIRDARLTAGTSQSAVAKAAHVSANTVSRIETGQLAQLSIAEALVVADAVGLDLSVRAYPGRRPTRDAAHAKKLHELLGHVGAPLKYRLEAPLPPREGVPEQRAWDALIGAPDGETGVELEMRLYDLQAQTRRILLKWRDSGAQRLLLLISDTQANRRSLRTFPAYFAVLPRLKTAALLATLQSGTRPETGYALI